MKRIIVCLDGTWNSIDGGRPTTNVVHIRDALRSAATGGEIFQRIYYDEGVGSGDDPVDKVFGGAFGVGLARNVRQAYKYICRHYEPGDEIYLTGFSRGAYTARSVAGMIGACGVLRAEACTEENEALVWNYYHTDQKDRAAGEETKWVGHCHPDVRIKAVAVFDTVGTLGIPDRAFNWIFRSRFSFHDTRLGAIVDNAFHALAIDEKREAFVATLWERPFNPTAPFGNVEQVWFPGVHADIGGGYADPHLSRVSLDWMTGRLRSLGVDFEDGVLKELGIGKHRELRPTAAMHESRKFPAYVRDWMEPHFRQITRRGAIKPRPGDTEQTRYDPIREFVHISALERRRRMPDYRPRNLEKVLALIGTGLPVIGWAGEVLPPDRAQALLG